MIHTGTLPQLALIHLCTHARVSFNLGNIYFSKLQLLANVVMLQNRHIIDISMNHAFHKRYMKVSVASQLAAA